MIIVRNNILINKYIITKITITTITTITITIIIRRKMITNTEQVYMIVQVKLDIDQLCQLFLNKKYNVVLLYLIFQQYSVKYMLNIQSTRCNKYNNGYNWVVKQLNNMVGYVYVLTKQTSIWIAIII